MSNQPSLTPAMLSGIDNAIAASNAPIYRYIPHSHAEFVDWMRASGHEGRVVDFLAQRDDCANAAPAGWTRLAKVEVSTWFQGLPQDLRRIISQGLIGEVAYDAYVEWQGVNA